MDLLVYYANLEKTPQGEILTPTLKLCLMIIILEDGEAFPSSLQRQLNFESVKSVYRLLKTLTEAGFIENLPSRNELGHKQEPRLLALNPGNIQVTTLVPGNIQVTKDEKPGNIQVTRLFQENNGNSHNFNNLTQKPGNIQVTREKPGNIQVTTLKSSNGNKTNTLDKTSNGTKFALKTPLPVFNSIKGGGEEKPGNIQVTRDVIENPFVSLWFGLMKQEISADAAELIIERVSNLICWKESLQEWRANPKWDKSNVGGQISKYEKKLKRGEYNEENLETSTPPRKQKTQEQKDEDERIRKEIYGE